MGYNIKHFYYLYLHCYDILTLFINNFQEKSQRIKKSINCLHL